MFKTLINAWNVKDIRTKMLRQVVTAVADGANAVASVQNYLIHRRD